MKLIDLHCDTALALYTQKKSILENNLHISLNRAAVFDKYVQLAAVFTPPFLTDEEGWEQFLRVREYLESECAKNSVPLLRTAEDLADFEASDAHAAFLLTVEDARILAGKAERVKTLFDWGVRVITPLWGGKTCIGGSHDTEEGLTDFGKEAVSEMITLGILPDISHASFPSTDEILDLCEAANVSPVATHMNAYAVHAHTRNLTDERFRRLVRLGGMAGVSLCPPHLTTDEDAVSSRDVLRHLCHYHRLAPHGVGFGCDYDGTDTPADLAEISRLPALADLLKQEGLTAEDIDQIYYGNARRYLMKHLPRRK